MLTIFTIPKPFRGHIGIIQRNAIESWKRAVPGSEIYLFGDEEGIRETAERCSVRHVPLIPKNEFGTPRLDFIFNFIPENSSLDTRCYINCDIILTADFIGAIRKIPFAEFLLAGQRCNVDVGAPLDFAGGWEESLKGYARQHGVSEGPEAIDYFVFRRKSRIDMPPLVVGRKGWDNWFIFDMRRARIPVVDISGVVRVFHQNHDYSHVPQKTAEKWEGPESDYNMKLIGGGKAGLYSWSLLDATHLLTRKGLVKKTLTLQELLRRLTLQTPPRAHGILQVLFQMYYGYIRFFRLFSRKT